MTTQTAQHLGEVTLKTAFVFGCCLALYLRLEIFTWLLLAPFVGVGAFVFGRREERIGVAAFLAMLAATRQFFGLGARSPGVIVVDVLFLAVILIVAIRSERWWPSWAAAFQVAAVATRLVFFVPNPPIKLPEYLVSSAIWTWLVLIALSIGAWDRWGQRDRQVRRGGRITAAFALMAAFALWYVWPALPSRLAEIGITP